MDIIGMDRYARYLGNFLQLAALYRQIRHNRAKRSIYGLSYDLVVYTFLGYVCSVVFTLHYIFDGTVGLQYGRRNPIHSAFAVDSHQIVADSIGLALTIILVLQMMLYDNTANVNQGISGLTFFTLGGFGSLGAFIYACTSPDPEKIGKHGLFLLDVLDWIWFVGKYSDCVRIVPQISMNWIGECATGYNPSTNVLTWVSAIVWLMARTLLNSPYYEVPLNIPTYPYIFTTISFSGFIMFQSSFLYANNKPSLRTKFEQAASWDEAHSMA